MASLVLTGDTSGQVTLAAPAVAGSNTLTLQAATATNAVNTLATAVASTSGTSIDFTGLPSWVKKITVMLSGVSLSGAGLPIIQIGSGSVETTGYVSYAGYVAASSGATTATTYFLIRAGGSVSADVVYGIATIALVGSNIWVYSFSGGMNSAGNYGLVGGGTKTTSGTLDRVRITSTNGTDTFDAGTVNILYEG